MVLQTRAAGLVTALIIALASQNLAAQGGTVFLDWQAPDRSCATRDELEKRVEYILGKPVFSENKEDVQIISGTVHPDAGTNGWKATVRADWDSQETGTVRTLDTDSSDCRQLDDEIALVVALMIDEFISGKKNSEDAPSRPIEQVSIDEGNAPEEPATGDQISPPATEETREHRELWFAIEGLGMYELLPKIAWGAGLRGEFKGLRVWPIYLRLAGWPLAKVERNDTKGTFSAFSASVGLCPRVFTRQRVLLSVCFGVMSGIVKARGVNLDTSKTQIRPLFQVEAGVTFRLEISDPLWAVAGIGAGATVIRDKFEYTLDNRETRMLHEANLVVPVFSLGVELRFSQKK